MQSAIPLARRGGPLFRQVYLGLRKAVLSGAFQDGRRLPSTRELAQQLYERYLRRVRRTNASRREVLLDSVRKHLRRLGKALPAP